MLAVLLFAFEKCFPFNIFFKKIGVLDSYFIHRYIIIKYKSSAIRVKSANYYESYGPFFSFFNFIFCKMPECWWGWPLDGGICVILTHF